MRTLSILVLSLLLALGLSAQDCFELRTYHAAPGKLEALQQRFQHHTLAFFEKHGMTNVAYWLPVENSGNTLVYLLAYPDKAAREASWKAFQADPEWIKAKAASEVDGKLVEKVESLFLARTDYSPALPLASAETPRVFEMRRYTTREGRLPALDARFRDHTLGLFQKHGMTNLLYFHLEAGQEGAENTLLYFLAHASEDAKKSAFKTFGEDPEWKTVRDASERDGKILVDKGVVSTLLIPTGFSPLK